MREKQGYREVLEFLTERGCPLLLTRSAAAEFLSISRPHLNKLIREKAIKVQENKIPIGSIASYLCG